jgi:hypothetical protein
VPKYRADVTISKVWSGVEVEADNETDAELAMSKMTEAELSNFDTPSEDCEVDDIEEMDDEEEAE